MFNKSMIMKKSIFAAVVLSAAVLFTACDPNKNKTEVTGIAINPSELTLNPGDESRLSAKSIRQAGSV